MVLIDHYLAIKRLHVSLVAVSGALFAWRGAAVLARQHWAMLKPWRAASYVIDTALLAAGVMLWAMLRLNPLLQPWLLAKLALLVLYIVLGSLALKRGRTPRARRAGYVGALATYLFMASVAVWHHPLGVVSAWGIR